MPVDVVQGSAIYETIEVVNLNPAVAQGSLALVQMLPSGWEIFNDRLYGTASASEPECDYKDMRDDCVKWFFSLPGGASKTFRVRLQATYEGEFALPAAVCESMYDSAVSACSASSTAIVRR